MGRGTSLVSCYIINITLWCEGACTFRTFPHKLKPSANKDHEGSEYQTTNIGMSHGVMCIKQLIPWLVSMWPVLTNHTWVLQAVYIAYTACLAFCSHIVLKEQYSHTHTTFTQINVTRQNWNVTFIMYVASSLDYKPITKLTPYLLPCILQLDQVITTLWNNHNNNSTETHCRQITHGSLWQE